MTDLPPRHQAIVDRLRDGPATTTDLAAACESSPAYVRVTVRRLQRRGYQIVNVNGHGGGCYMLTRRPSETQPGRRIGVCKHPIAHDHEEDSLCSPCQRKARDAELGMLHAEALL